MPRPKLTNAEALNWRARALAAEKAIEQQRNAWAKEWPGGTDIGRCELSIELTAAIKTARKLRHAVVVTDFGDGKFTFVACELPKGS